jgi:hypothetical protein
LAICFDEVGDFDGMLHRGSGIFSRRGNSATL